MDPDCVLIVNTHDGWGQRQVDQGSDWHAEEDTALPGSMRTLSRSVSQPAHTGAPPGAAPPRRDRPLPPNAALDARVSESNVWTNDADVGTSTKRITHSLGQYTLTEYITPHCRASTCGHEIICILRTAYSTVVVRLSYV